MAKEAALKPAAIKANMALVVIARVINPKFDSQTKSRCVSYGARSSLWTPDPKFVKKLADGDILKRAAEEELARAAKQAARKTDGKMSAAVAVPKLLDAKLAGTRRSAEAVLILTEGDSARSFAIAGLDALGRDRHGVFPLKGKPINARSNSPAKVSANAEVTALKKILGLRESEKHVDEDGRPTNLRYGSVLVLTDADHGAFL